MMKFGKIIQRQCQISVLLSMEHWIHCSDQGIKVLAENRNAVSLYPQRMPYVLVLDRTWDYFSLLITLAMAQLCIRNKNMLAE